ncbi:hypothetical protein G6F59_014441 [Rhizopus arrhizus]|nr:hypothetical protein G6F59_014441 [Rhizopus arrhizus]
MGNDMLRTLLGRTSCVAGIACLLFAGVSTRAVADYPAKPIKLVVPQAAGGGTDVIGRLWADYVARQLKTPVVVENRPGANGILASSYVAKQPADGYTVLVSGVSYLAVNPQMYKNMPYQPARDFDGVSLLVNTPFLLVAGTQTGIRSLDELVARAKAEPESLNFASAGKGNSPHLVVEMLAQKTGMKLTHVPPR